MICSSCRRTLLVNLRRPHVRTIATVPSTSNAAPITPPPGTSSTDSNNTTPATSSATPGISQPLSTEILPSTSTAKSKPATTNAEKRVKLQGSIPGGKELKGLGYLKAHPVILAKEDDEYPPWLWTLLDNNQATDGKPTIDLTALSKTQRIKYDRKQAKLTKDIPKPIPIHEQSKDLTSSGDSASVSLSRRQELTKSSRDARRKGIRESNFLKAM